MTRQEWEIFVPLYQDFIRNLEAAERDTFNCVLVGPPNVDGGELVDYMAYTYQRCDDYNEYYDRQLSVKFFIDEEKEAALQEFKDQQEEIRLAKIRRQQEEAEARQEKQRKQELRLLADLQKKYAQPKD